MAESGTGPSQPSRRDQILMCADPPFMGLKPPKGIAQTIKRACARRDYKAFVWGFPLSSGWVESCWESVSKYDKGIQQAEVVASAVDYMRLDCAEVWPEAITEWMVVHVDPETYGLNWAFFLSFGPFKPEPDVLEKLKKLMEMYGVLELPFYYPRRL